MISGGGRWQAIIAAPYLASPVPAWNPRNGSRNRCPQRALRCHCARPARRCRCRRCRARRGRIDRAFAAPRQDRKARALGELRSRPARAVRQAPGDRVFERPLGRSPRRARRARGYDGPRRARGPVLRHCRSGSDHARLARSRHLRSRRAGGRKAATAKVPIVFDPRVARSLLGHLVGAIVGPAIARGTSFLKDKLGERIFPASVTVFDDPHRQRGLRSKPFDGEGIANRRRAVIEKGVLTTWLLDLRSARQLGLATTGHASRGTSSPPSPSPTNLWLEPGAVTAQELIGDIDKGFYVNELMGMGVNGVTGDYRRRAPGFWIAS